jgi:hypothetical protein
VRRGQVLHDHEADPGFARQVAQQLLDRFQASGGSPYCDDRNGGRAR